MMAALQGNHVEAARTVAPLRLLMQEQAGGKHQHNISGQEADAGGARVVPYQR